MVGGYLGISEYNPHIVTCNKHDKWICESRGLLALLVMDLTIVLEEVIRDRLFIQIISFGVGKL